MLCILAQAASAGGQAGAFERATAWMVEFASGPASTFWLLAWAFAESSFFPFPPDALLIALCLASGESLAACMWFAGVCLLGSAAGGVFGYGLGVWPGRPVLEKIASPEKIVAVERLLQRYDVWAVGAAGFTPIPYKIFTIASGLLRVKLVRFVLVSIASRGARFFLVAILCFAVGERVTAFLKNQLEWVTLAFFVGLVGGFYVVKLIARRRPPAGTAGGETGLPVRRQTGDGAPGATGPEDRAVPGA